MHSDQVSYPWFAVQVRPRYEKLVAQVLENKGYEQFLPLQRQRRAWSDRIKKIDQPLFPGYLFARFDPSSRLPILITPGVIRVVASAGTPLPVDVKEIDAIRAIVSSGLAAQPWPYLTVGQRVSIGHGSLRGLEGILVAVKNSRRLVLSVTLLQRSVAVEIDQEVVTAVAAPKMLPRLGASTLQRSSAA